MKWFFDTSVLIPTFLEDQEHHESSLRAFLKADRRSACCAAHSLAEVYANHTRLPGRHRLGGEQVLLFLENIRERLALVTLDHEEYFAALRQAAEAGIVGGAVYDALLAHCALKSHAGTIYTWNVRHFQQMGSKIARRAKMP
jgi:predicted nucleic acid-binding protein